MLVNDLLLPGDELPALREMMRRIVAYNDRQTGTPEECWVAPVFNCLIASDGALKFEALIMPASVRRSASAFLGHFSDEMHAFTDELMAFKPEPEPQP